MTESLSDRLQKIKRRAPAALRAAENAGELERWRVKYLGRKGVLPLLLRELKQLPLPARRRLGQEGNKLRRRLDGLYRRKLRRLEVDNIKKDRAAPATARMPIRGHLHPLTLARRRIEAIFLAMGFVLVEGPEVEEARLNFDQLNIPLEHPARAETDTFYLAKRAGLPDLVLRTSTSPVQLRAVFEHDLVPPFKILSPGRVFRPEKTDPTHETTFYQFEGLVVGDKATVADFKGTVETFYETFFGRRVKIRLRPSYFPFVEPGFEVDLSCLFCRGAADTRCRVCKNTGWIEVMGAGMVHPNVLKNMNVDPREYQGYAFGGVIDRLPMLSHGIDDIRLFWSGDIRFLKQFS